MLEKIKIIKIIKKLKQASVDEGFLKSLRSRLEVRISANPVIKPAEERLFLTERSTLSGLFFKLKTMPIPLIIALIAILSGGGVTMASQASLPGETLYPVKILTEDIRSVIALNPEAKVKLEVKFAAERVAEVKEMLAEKGVEPRGLDIALSRFQKHIARAAEIIEVEKQKGKDVSKLAGETVDNFHIQKKAAKQAFEDAKQEFFTKKKQLHDQLLEAIKSGDTAGQEHIRAELADLEAAKDEAEAKKDVAIAVLEAEKDRLQDKLEETKQQEEEALDAAERADEELEEREEEQQELKEKIKEEQAEVEKEIREAIKNVKEED
ncbi:MAG: hypothetical protein HY773_01470 [Candidatus Terrybacteria bacterium]|nr:hypothetical protein [Candidatus Terrybacteria bacterium]